MVAHALALAAAHSGEAETLCRRWRRHAAVRRCVALALIMLSALTLVGNASSSQAQGTWATGAASAEESVTAVRQMLDNQCNRRR